MLAYNKILLENTFLRAEAYSLLKAGFLLKEQKELIDKQLPAYNKQNIFVRIGLFVLACFFYSSCCGLFAFITAIGGNDHYAWTFMVYAIFGFASLEFVIRRFNYYANGLDDAFLFCAQVSFLISVGFMLDSFDTLILLFLCGTIMGCLCCLRYADRFSALIACLSFTSFFTNVFFEAGALGQQLLPFLLMILAGGMYFLFRRLKEKTEKEDTYKASVNVCLAFSLLLLYVSCNYFVVREARVELLNTPIVPGDDIPLAVLFYALTFSIPASYIYFSLIKKDRMLLWIGLITFTLSILTVRYYYQVIPAEIALILGGFILFVIAYLGMRSLKEKRNGLTYEPDRFTDTNTPASAETLALLQYYAVKPGSQAGDGVEFGGGEFGGGGSGNNY